MQLFYSLVRLSYTLILLGGSFLDDWLRKYYAGLEGFTVKSTGIGTDGFPYLEMTRTVKYENDTSSIEKIKVEVSCGSHR